MNRRNIIALPAGMAALIALPVSAAPTTDRAGVSDPDAELLSLCRRFMNLERRQRILFDRECEAERAGDRDRARRLSDLYRSFVPYHHHLKAEIVEARPQTQEGLLAKARVFMTLVQRDLDGDPLGDEGPLWSLCRDLLGHDPGEGAA